jgi:hypothetical protein
VLAEFKGFLLKTNALALAIGVIIGGALGTVPFCKEANAVDASRCKACTSEI